MWQLAGTTAVIGMGVVFASLFLLSVYMHYFKVFVAHLERRSAGAKGATLGKERRSPATAQSSAGASGSGAAGGTGPRPDEERPALGPVVAAIAAALFVPRHGLAAAAAAPVRVPTGWRMSAQLASMNARAARQSRPRPRVRPLGDFSRPRRDDSTKPEPVWTATPLGGRHRARSAQ